jgi:hypothetical protein
MNEIAILKIAWRILVFYEVGPLAQHLRCKTGRNKREFFKAMCQ